MMIMIMIMIMIICWISFNLVNDNDDNDDDNDNDNQPDILQPVRRWWWYWLLVYNHCDEDHDHDESSNLFVIGPMSFATTSTRSWESGHLSVWVHISLYSQYSIFVLVQCISEWYISGVIMRKSLILEINLQHQGLQLSCIISTDSSAKVWLLCGSLCKCEDAVYTGPPFKTTNDGVKRRSCATKTTNAPKV